MSSLRFAGALEDTTEIILNCEAQFRSRLSVSRSQDGHACHAEGEGMHQVTADIQLEVGPDVEILDKDLHHRLTSPPRGKLDHGAAAQGRPGIRFCGEVTSMKTSPSAISRSMRCTRPSKKVNYVVEAARVGQATDYDKLTLDVWTNGCVAPQDAVGVASKLLKDHLTIFVNFEEEGPVDEATAMETGTRCASRTT